MAAWGRFGSSEGEDRAQDREWEAEQRERDRRLELKKVYLERGIDLDAPEEPLVCPSCGTRYDFGAECPDCRARLVGVSSADLVDPEIAPEPRVYPRAVRVAAVVALFAAMLLLARHLLGQFL